MERLVEQRRKIESYCTLGFKALIGSQIRFQLAIIHLKLFQDTGDLPSFPKILCFTEIYLQMY